MDFLLPVAFYFPSSFPRRLKTKYINLSISKILQFKPIWGKCHAEGIQETFHKNKKGENNP